MTEIVIFQSRFKVDILFCAFLTQLIDTHFINTSRSFTVNFLYVIFIVTS